MGAKMSGFMAGLGAASGSLPAMMMMKKMGLFDKDEVKGKGKGKGGAMSSQMSDKNLEKAIKNDMKQAFAMEAMYGASPGASSSIPSYVGHAGGPAAYGTGIVADQPKMKLPPGVHGQIPQDRKPPKGLYGGKGGEMVGPRMPKGSPTSNVDKIFDAMERAWLGVR